MVAPVFSINSFIITCRCRAFFNAHLELCKYLVHGILRDFAKGQKFVRGDRQGTAFLQRNQ